MWRADLFQYYLQVKDVRQIKCLLCFIISDFRVVISEDLPCPGLGHCLQWNHGGVGSQRLRFGSLWPIPVSPTCPADQLLDSCMQLQSLLCCPHHTELVSHLNAVSQYWIHRARLAYFWPLCTAWGFLPSSSSRAALWISGTKPYHFKAPFHVFFQKELSVTLSCPSLNDVCSAFATSYCGNIAEVSLTIILCVPLYHGDISSLAKAGPSLHCQKPPPFFPLFPFTCQQLYVCAACHFCVWNRELWGFPPAKHQRVTLAFVISVWFTVHPFYSLHLASWSLIKWKSFACHGGMSPSHWDSGTLGSVAASVPQSHCRAQGHPQAPSSWGRDPSGANRCSLCLQSMTGITVSRVGAEMSLGTALHPCFNGKKTQVPTWLRAGLGDATGLWWMSCQSFGCSFDLILNECRTAFFFPL